MKILNEKDIARDVAKQLNITYEEVFSIYRSAIAYTVHVMKHSAFETIKLSYLGKFLVKPFRLKKYNENKVRRNNGTI
jgi:energy-converting hydrogenase A subunit M